MAQPLQGSSFDHGSQSILRRYSPNFHRHYGERWMEVLRQNGYIFMGDSRTPGTRWAPPWNPTRVLTVPYGDDQPVIWRNACPHNWKRLVQTTALPEQVSTMKPIVCGFHSLSFDQVGQIRRCGHMEIEVAALPEQRCAVSPQYVWPSQGLVFELGRNAERAREELGRSLAFVDKEGRDLFDFRDFELHSSVAALQAGDALMSIVNFVDIRHIRNHRETLAPLVDLNDYEHRASDDGAGVIQFMGVSPTVLFTHLGKLYQQAELPNPQYGAAWVTTPMGLMLEAYLPPAGALVVSQCFPHPKDPLVCTFYHSFYYHREHMREYRLARDKRATFIGGHQKVFKDTGDEDELWCREATANLEVMMAEGRGGEEWGFFDPAQENYGRWYYQMAEQRLRELVGR